MIQEPAEVINGYVTRLRGLAKTCKFDKVDEVIQDQVINKCASNNLCRRLSRQTDLKLDRLLQIAWLLEASNLHATTIEADSEQSLQHVNQIASDLVINLEWFIVYFWDCNLGIVYKQGLIIFVWRCYVI